MAFLKFEKDLVMNNNDNNSDFMADVAKTAFEGAVVAVAIFLISTKMKGGKHVSN